MLLALPVLSELLIFFVLVVIGIIIILLIKAVIQLIIPIVAAVLAWYLTHSLIYAGIAFLVVAVLQLILKRK
jgi:hypothetical protein